MRILNLVRFGYGRGTEGLLCLTFLSFSVRVGMKFFEFSSDYKNKNKLISSEKYQFEVFYED